MEFGLLLSLASAMNPTFIYLVYLILKRKNPTYVVSLKKKENKRLAFNHIRTDFFFT